MNSRRILLLYAALLLTLASGCAAVAARKAKSAVLGAWDSAFPIVIADRDLAGYPNVIVAKFSCDFEDKLAGVFALSDIRHDLVKQINEDEELKKKALMSAACVSASPTLLIEGELLDCEKGHKLRRATTLGGQAHIIMRYTVKDFSTGEVLAVFNSRGFITGNLTLGGDIKDAIPEVNKGVIRYLKGDLREK